MNLQEYEIKYFLWAYFNVFISLISCVFYGFQKFYIVFQVDRISKLMWNIVELNQLPLEEMGIAHKPINQSIK